MLLWQLLAVVYDILQPVTPANRLLCCCGSCWRWCTTRSRAWRSPSCALCFSTSERPACTPSGCWSQPRWAPARHSAPPLNASSVSPNFLSTPLLFHPTSSQRLFCFTQLPLNTSSVSPNFPSKSVWGCDFTHVSLKCSFFPPKFL